MKLKELVGEIDGLHYWVDAYAESVEDELDREKFADVAEYIRILRLLVEMAPSELLDKIQL